MQRIAETDEAGVATVCGGEQAGHATAIRLAADDERRGRPQRDGSFAVDGHDLLGGAHRKVDGGRGQATLLQAFDMRTHGGGRT